eukprot:11377340-Karenia_brevis.AAC.1
MLARKILALLDGDDADRAIDELCGHVLEHSMQRSCCWAVQASMMAVSGNQLVILMHELRGHVLVASKSPYANFVLQTAIEYSMSSDISFVLRELQGSAMQ